LDARSAASEPKEAAALVGSLGVLPSASLGRRRRDGTGRGLGDEGVK